MSAIDIARLRAPAARRELGWALAALAFSAAAAAVLYALRPSPPTDDTYAFLDWGRDLRHGMVPDISGRTFHPIPVLYGAIVTVLGNASLTATVILSIAALLLIALGVWRIVTRLGVPQPAPAVAALLVVSNPMLPALALAAYVNLWFALLIVWAALWDLEGRRRRAWALLLIAGLVRPEGWAYLVAYGGLAWWRAGRPRDRSRWLPVAALALAPMLLWIAIEWIAFGSPLYSFTHTAKLVDTSAHRVGHLTVPAELWHDFRDSTTWPVMPFLLAGVIAILRAPRNPRQTGFLVLAATAPLTVLLLAASGLNLPSRHLSVVTSFGTVFAAVGAVRLPQLLAPAAARLVTAARSATLRAVTVAVAGVTATALLVGGALAVSTRPLRDEVRSVRVARDYTGSLASAIDGRRADLDSLALGSQSVAIIGAIAQSELVWALRVPYSVVTGQLVPQTRMIVQPSQATWSWLFKQGLTDRPRTTPPAGWRNVSNDPRWEIYLAPELAAALPPTPAP